MKHCNRHTPILLSLGAVLGLYTTGCARSYIGQTASVRAAYESGDEDQAILLLDAQETELRAKDELLYLLDRGMILHAAQRFEESIQTLAEAEELAERLDIVSISEEGAKVLIDERQSHYRGEDFEVLLINILQALNYAALNNLEDALVEVRRADLVMKRMQDEQKKPYQQLAMARYLGGVLYESAGRLDSAAIDYIKADQLGDLAGLSGPLLRLAKRLRRPELKALMQKYPEDHIDQSTDATPKPPNNSGAGFGELVVVMEYGLAPYKASSKRDFGNAELVVVPEFRYSPPSPHAPVVDIDGAVIPAVLVTSINEVAAEHLEHRLSGLVAKQIAGTVAKGVVAAGIGAVTKQEELGWLAFWLLNAAKDADVRSWRSLPAEFRVARHSLSVGEHRVQCGDQSRDVTIRAAQISLMLCRVY